MYSLKNPYKFNLESYNLIDYILNLFLYIINLNFTNLISLKTYIVINFKIHEIS